MTQCIAKIKNSERQCSRDAELNGYCTFHYVMVTTGYKHTTKYWKDKCKICDKPIKLFPNGTCYTCKEYGKT